MQSLLPLKSDLQKCELPPYRNENNILTPCERSHPDHQYVRKIQSEFQGRYVNQRDMDLENKPKVVVIGKLVEDDLFSKMRSALGKVY
jgi:putative ABC transport system permease protein